MQLKRSDTKPLIEAHRGASDAFPENTMTAFRAAVEARADSIELDVHQTHDGHWVVMHDATVDRTTNGSGGIADMTLAQIRALDCGAWKEDRFRGEPVPMLSEVVNLAARQGMRLNVEIKAFRDAADGPAALVSILRGGNLDPSALVVSSFELHALLAVRGQQHCIRLAILGDADRALDLALTHRFAWVHAKGETLTERHIRQAHDAGRNVMAWTVDAPETFLRLAAWGVDKICTNRPAAMRRLYRDTEELRGPEKGQSRF